MILSEMIGNIARPGIGVGRGLVQAIRGSLDLGASRDKLSPEYLRYLSYFGKDAEGNKFFRVPYEGSNETMEQLLMRGSRKKYR